nr:FCP1-like domain, HAD-like domain protein [Tanacetum cinerariifolium]
MADPLTSLMYVGQLMMFLQTPIFKTFRERDGTGINDREYRIFYHRHQLEVSFIFVEDDNVKPSSSSGVFSDGNDNDEVAAKLTKSHKNYKRRKLKIEWNKNLGSLDKREGINPGSLGSLASIDPKMMVLSPAVIDEKSSIPSTNETDQIASGDSLSTKVHESVSGETGTRKTVTDSTTSKKRKSTQRAKKTAASDVFSDKVDEVVSGETVMSKTVTDDTTPK